MEQTRKAGRQVLRPMLPRDGSRIQMPLVETREGLSIEAFQSEYVSKYRPVLIKNAAKEWPAVSKWNDKYFIDTFGHLTVRVEDRTEIPPTVLRMNIGEYLDVILSEKESKPNYYLTETPLAPGNPIRQDIKKPIYCENRLDLEYPLLWYGPAGTRSPLHFDLGHNLFVQVRGSKRVILVPAKEACFLQTRPWNHQLAQISDIDILDPDPARYPGLAKITPQEVTVEPGDMLYIPSMWWHDIGSLEVNISLNFFWANKRPIKTWPRSINVLCAILTGGLRMPLSIFHVAYVIGYVKNLGTRALRGFERIPSK